MMTPKDAATDYHKAVKALDKAERAHRRNLDDFYQARESRSPISLTMSRRACASSEAALIEAVEAAHTAHRAYWRARADELLPAIQRAAVEFAAYDALAKLAGDTTCRPAVQMLQSLSIEFTANQRLQLQSMLELDADGIPQESPDCELLDERGIWR